MTVKVVITPPKKKKNNPKMNTVLWEIKKFKSLDLSIFQIMGSSNLHQQVYLMNLLWDKVMSVQISLKAYHFLNFCIYPIPLL